MTDDLVFTAAEVASLLRVSETTVLALVRRRVLEKVPHVRPTRITRRSVMKLLHEDYHVADGQSDRTAPPQAAAPGRGNGRTAQGPLAGEAVGGRGPLPRRIGPAAGDVVIRRVT